MDQRVHDLLTESQSAFRRNTWLCCENSGTGYNRWLLKWLPTAIEPLGNALECGLDPVTCWQWKKKTQQKCQNGISKIKLQNIVTLSCWPALWLLFFLFWWSKLPCDELPYGEAQVKKNWGRPLTNIPWGTESFQPWQWALMIPSQSNLTRIQWQQS